MNASPALAPAGSSGELHVSSLLVQGRPGRAGAIAEAILRMADAEVPVRDGDKLVVTLLSGSERAVLDAVAAIRGLPGVLFAELVFHRFERDEEALR